MTIFIVYPNAEQEKLLEAFLETNNIDFVKDDDQEVPPHVIEEIAQGEADIEAGRFITHKEFLKKFPTK